MNDVMEKEELKKLLIESVEKLIDSFSSELKNSNCLDENDESFFESIDQLRFGLELIKGVNNG